MSEGAPTAAAMIPNVIHFVWFGAAFPLTNALAVRSVAASNRDATIVLHHADDLAGQPHVDALVRDLPSLRLSRLDLTALLVGEDPEVDLGALRAVCAQLATEKRWAPLSDVVRYLVLRREGGIYLDLDVLVVRDLTPLRSSAAFCGRERILVDGALARSKLSWTRFPRTAPLELLRLACTNAARGIRWWKTVEGLYTAAVNNAVLGAVPGHPLLTEALAAVPARLPALAKRRSALGPDLLQDLLRRPAHADVTVLPPRAFYPLGPTVARHYFRIRPDAARAAAELLTPETYVLHWYNDGLRDLARPPDEESLRRLREAQLYAHFAAPLLPASA